MLARRSLAILTAAMKKVRWTESETAHLAAHYPAISAERLRALLPDRTAKAIKDKAVEMQIGKAQVRRQEAGRENVKKRWYPPPIET